MSACRAKQTDEAERGETRQEGEKPCRRKGGGPGKPVIVGRSGIAVPVDEKRTLWADSAVGDENLKRGAIRGTDGEFELRRAVSAASEASPTCCRKASTVRYLAGSGEAESL
jgi:hypothetical protein